MELLEEEAVVALQVPVEMEETVQNGMHLTDLEVEEVEDLVHQPVEVEVYMVLEEVLLQTVLVAMVLKVSLLLHITQHIFF